MWYCNCLPFHKQSHSAPTKHQQLSLEQHRSSPNCIIYCDNGLKCLPSGFSKCQSLVTYLFNRNGTENRATNIAVFRHFTTSVHFMYSAADSIVIVQCWWQYSLCTVLLTVQFMYSAADSTVHVQCCWQYSLCKVLQTIKIIYSAADSIVYVQCCWQYSLCTVLLTVQFMYSAASSHWPYTYK